MTTINIKVRKIDDEYRVAWIQDGIDAVETSKTMRGEALDYMNQLAEFEVENGERKNIVIDMTYDEEMDVYGYKVIENGIEAEAMAYEGEDVDDAFTRAKKEVKFQQVSYPHANVTLNNSVY